MKSAPLDLAEGFPPADAEQWRTLVEKALAGKPFEHLRTKLPDGLIVESVYAAKDARSPAAIGGRVGAWDIRQIVSRNDVGAANAEILADLEGGVTSIELQVDQGDGHGLAIKTPDDFSRALEGVEIDLAPIAIVSGATVDAAQALSAFVAKRNLRDARLAFNLNPFDGLFAQPATAPLTAALAAARKLGDEFTKASVLRVDARPMHEAGGSERQELAAMLAMGVAYLRAGEAIGWAPEEAARRILFTLAAGPDLIVELAKLRAARLVWERLLDACGGKAPMTIQSVTGERMLTRRDPWVNLLRVTAAGFAGGVGGADIVTTLPLTHAIGQPPPFARRLARNTQILLQEESHLARVADPAAGAWSIEKLTDDLARSAWALFQEIETRGGMESAFPWFAAEVGKTQDARLRDVRRRKNEITGVSAFPLLGERRVQADPWPRPETPRARLPKIRLAQAFEDLRDRAWLKGSPAVFLATLGAPATFSARESFVRGLFEAGGIKAVGGEIDHTADVGEAFRNSGAVAACLCGADETYTQSAGAIAGALKGAGCKFVVLAGKPGESEAALRAAGVDAFAFAGDDAVTFLESVHNALGIP